MTTETLPASSDAVRWARRSLRIDDVESASSTAELLRRVTEWEFVVSPETADAVQLLANPAGLAAGSNFAALATQRGCEQRWEALVADFANEFFDLTPDQRGQRWRVLMDECPQIPSLVPWIFNLALGIEIAGVPSSTDDRFNELVQSCCQSFVARPPANIRMRQEFMAMCRADPDQWEAVANGLQSTHADFVRHVAPWIEDFSDHQWRESLQAAKPAHARVSWPVPLEPIPPSRWILFCNQCEEWARFLAKLTIAGLLVLLVYSLVVLAFALLGPL